MKKTIIVAFTLFSTFNAMSQSGLKKGDVAPTFAAKDISGKPIDLAKLLKKNKAVVLFFYRGQWCPYCNKYIHQLQDSLQMLTTKGAYVVGVTPETDENINKTIEKTHASFSLVHDNNYAIMKAYNVNYAMDTAMVTRYKGVGIDLEKNNGNTDHILPVPATYIIDQSGKIIFVQFDKNYKKRPSVASLLEVLEK